jgi:hypothetical protein
MWWHEWKVNDGWELGAEGAGSRAERGDTEFFFEGESVVLSKTSRENAVFFAGWINHLAPF